MVSAETPAASVPHPHWLFRWGPSGRPRGRRRALFCCGLGFPASGRPAVRMAGKGGPGGSRRPGTRGPGRVVAQTARESRTRSQRAPRTLVDGRHEKVGGGPDTSPKGLGLSTSSSPSCGPAKASALRHSSPWLPGGPGAGRAEAALPPGGSVQRRREALPKLGCTFRA